MTAIPIQACFATSYQGGGSAATLDCRNVPPESCSLSAPSKFHCQLAWILIVYFPFQSFSKNKKNDCRSRWQAGNLEQAGRAYLLAYRNLNQMSIRQGVQSKLVYYMHHTYCLRNGTLAWLMVPKWHVTWLNWALPCANYRSKISNHSTCEAFGHVLAEGIVQNRDLDIKLFAWRDGACKTYIYKFYNFIILPQASNDQQV